MEYTLTIECHGGDNYTVRMGDTYHGDLTWDEMLGQIAYITCPKDEKRQALYRMMTDADWAEERARRQAWRTANERSST